MWLLVDFGVVLWLVVCGVCVCSMCVVLGLVVIVSVCCFGDDCDVE